MDRVFGYGSLAAGAADAAAVRCRLRGWRRGWGVAMDNGVAVPGYKQWETASGERPAVMVCFLDVEPAAGSVVGGVALPVDGAAALAALDARERNYVRVDVTDAVDARLGGRVWAYVGRPEARARAAAGRAAGQAVVASGYLELVASGLAAHGLEPVEAPDVPVLELHRVDLPAAEG